MDMLSVFTLRGERKPRLGASARTAYGFDEATGSNSMTRSPL